jgi:uncharacterized protein GlcG (DUF336 family)
MRKLHAFTLVAGCVLAVGACGDDSSTTAPQVQTASVSKFLPDHNTLRAMLREVLEEQNGGLGFEMWATILDRDGRVVDVVFSGENRGDQWPGSRVISAQKAYTANAFSLDKTSSANGSGQAKGLALSTANLYSAVQPGGSLYGLQHSNPVNTGVVYDPAPAQFGGPGDPMTQKKTGGVNVFGGGLALYGEGNRVVGAVGVSGDTSCADHFIAWRVRQALNLDFLAGVGGVSGDAARPDNIVFDITDNPAGGSGVSKGGFGHPKCLNTGDASTLPAVR